MRIGYMPYLNSAVFYEGFDRHNFELIELPPRNMAAAMRSGELDAGPLPIFEVLRMSDTVEHGTLGVATDGRAYSVLLFSKVPAKNLSGESIAVTPDTATSVQLLRVLLRDRWIAGDVDLRGPDDDCAACLLIGDKALRKVYQGHDWPFVYDLSWEWEQLTGLPFVFARWVVRSDLGDLRIGKFNLALHTSFARGIKSVAEIARRERIPGMPRSDALDYINSFTYELGDQEEAAVAEFKSRLSTLPQWRPPVMPYRSKRTTIPK